MNNTLLWTLFHAFAVVSVASAWEGAGLSSLFTVDTRDVYGGEVSAESADFHVDTRTCRIAEAGQMSDGSGRIRLSYSLADSSGTTASVAVAVSANGGASWTISPAAGSLSGDARTGVASGATKILYWDATATLASTTFGSNYKVRLTATPNNGRPAYAGVSSAFTLDLGNLQQGLAVAGRVLDKATRQPLGGSTVTLAGQTVSTGGNGSFSFPNVALLAGSELRVSKAGYVDTTVAVSPVAGSRQTTLADILLAAQAQPSAKPRVTHVPPDRTASSWPAHPSPTDSPLRSTGRGRRPAACGSTPTARS